MYYMGFGPDWLEASLTEQNFAIVYALFGWGRLSDRLVINPQPLTRDEIMREVQAYGEYVSSFIRERAARLPLSFLIAPAEDEQIPAQLDHWYEHDEGERVGEFVLYRLRLKP
jgi:hypothetical protein